MLPAELQNTNGCRHPADPPRFQVQYIQGAQGMCRDEIAERLDAFVETHLQVREILPETSVQIESIGRKRLFDPDRTEGGQPSEGFVVVLSKRSVRVEAKWYGREGESNGIERFEVHPGSDLEFDSSVTLFDGYPSTLDGVFYLVKKSQRDANRHAIQARGTPFFEQIGVPFSSQVVKRSVHDRRDRERPATQPAQGREYLLNGTLSRKARNNEVTYHLDCPRNKLSTVERIGTTGAFADPPIPDGIDPSQQEGVPIEPFTDGRPERLYLRHLDFNQFEPLQRDPGRKDRFRVRCSGFHVPGSGFGFTCRLVTTPRKHAETYSYETTDFNLDRLLRWLLLPMSRRSQIRFPRFRD